MTTKHHKVLIPDHVKIALQKQADYIAFEQHQPLVAMEWLEGIIEAIKSLAEFPHRYALAPENELLGANSEVEIRHLIYKKTFRVIFLVKNNEVRILRAKHAARLNS